MAALTSQWHSGHDALMASQRVMHSGLFAWVQAYNVSAGTVDLMYHPVYKANSSGDLQKCFFPIPNVTYPGDCDFALVPASGVVPLRLRARRARWRRAAQAAAASAQ